jgi:hypothetical protein
VLQQIEDVPLFVPGVGNDITSDLTTRIIFESLVNFTQKCMNDYPELLGDTRPRYVTERVWDPIGAVWVFKKFLLPTAAHKPLLLVPREWVSSNLLLNRTRFYETACLSQVQMDRATIALDGTLIMTPKDQLKQDPTLQRDYETIIKIVTDAYGAGTNVVEGFKRFAEHRYRKSA